MVSLISLEVILIPTFGVEKVEFFEIMIMTTGCGIAIIVIIISLYMIIKSTEWFNCKEYEKDDLLVIFLIYIN